MSISNSVEDFQNVSSFVVLTLTTDQSIDPLECNFTASTIFKSISIYIDCDDDLFIRFSSLRILFLAMQ